MIIDAGQLPEHEVLSADVAIVGAGPAGITVALGLKGSGLRVLLLEAGGRKGGRPDADGFAGGLADPHRHPPLTLYRARGLGGTSSLWGGRCVPFDPIDFEARPHVPHSGWPIGYDEMLPWYRRAVLRCEAGEFRFRAAEALGPQAAPMVPGLADADIDADGVERFSPPTDFGRRHRAVLAASKTVMVVVGATCVGLDFAESGRGVEGLRLASAPGRVFRVRAGIHVLAMGGLETPRLLLAAGLDRRLPCLGRFYMCHLEGKAAVARFPPGARIAFAYERGEDGVYLRRFFAFPAEVQRARRMTNVILRFEPPPIPDPVHGNPVLSAMFLVQALLRPEHRRLITRYDYRGTGAAGGGVAAHLANVGRGLPALGRFAADWARRRWLARRKLPYVAATGADGSFSLDYNAEQAPDPDSRVSLSDCRDAYGLPRLWVDWRVTGQDIAAVVTAHRLLADALRRCGVGSLSFDEAVIRGAYKAMASHHIGAARMAAGPHSGVVDRDCRVFGIDNLYLAGAAVFPTCSHANPTLTIVALAARLAEHLRQRS
jgi:choline dehydrogenase-like flavoprotein